MNDSIWFSKFLVMFVFVQEIAKENRNKSFGSSTPRRDSKTTDSGTSNGSAASQEQLDAANRKLKEQEKQKAALNR